MTIYKNKPAVNTTGNQQFYITTITRGDETFTKFGRSSDTSTRFQRYNKGLEKCIIEFHCTYDLPATCNWFQPDVIEGLVHDELRKAGNHYRPSFHFAGDNECYKETVDYVQRITDQKINEYLQRHATTEQLNSI